MAKKATMTEQTVPAQMTLEKLVQTEKVKLAGALQERNKQGEHLNQLVGAINERNEQLKQLHAEHQNVMLTIDRLNQVIHTLSGTLELCGVDLSKPLSDQSEAEPEHPVQLKDVPEEEEAPEN